jgi:DNA-binding transcriptional ArsR family regulator
MIPRSAAPGRLPEAAPLFAALGDSVRMRLIARLSHSGPLSIARLTDGTDVTRQAVTKHLHALEDVGLVRGTRAGRERLWELQPKRLAEARVYLEHIERQWDQALERLRVFLEAPPDRR